jgi:ubiquinone/menaquinone biosynthesis C-methylase UbiE
MTEWNSETAEWYAANYGDYPTNSLAVEQLDLPEQSTIVDVGCGTGSALRYAAAKVKSGNLIGIDPVPRMVEIAKAITKKHETNYQIIFKVGSAEDLPVEDSLADIVFAFDSIDHWNDIQQGLKEILRILKPGGRFIIVKDLSVPGAKKALNGLELKLGTARFVIGTKEIIKTEEVSFALWTCDLEIS